MERTAASAGEVNDLTDLPPLDLNKTPRSVCKNCGATLAGTERSVGLCPLCQDDEGGGRPHRQRQRQRLMRTTDGRTVTGMQTESASGSENRTSGGHPVEDIKRIIANPRRRVRTGPYAGEARLGKNLTGRLDPDTGDHVVRLYDTDVVRHHPNGDVSYNSGGFASQATREAMSTWGDPHHSFSTSKRKMYLHDRHPDVATTEHVDSQWGGYDRVTPKTHPFHDGMRMSGMERTPDYDNAHPDQAESAPRRQGYWGGSVYPPGHRDTFTQGGGRTAPTTSWQQRSGETPLGRNISPGHPMDRDRYGHDNAFGEGSGAPGQGYSRERDQRELRDAEQSRPEEGSYSGFSHRQPDVELHPQPNEFDVHQHLQEHHGYAAEHVGDMSPGGALHMHDREHSPAGGLGLSTPHKHDDPLNDEAPPMPGEHFDDYNRRMNERQVQRMKQRGIEAKVVREIANAALRSDTGLSRHAALVIGHRAVERFPALVERAQR